MKPTRVPYEESSVYSELNFYCPSKLDDFIGKVLFNITLYPANIIYIVVFLCVLFIYYVKIVLNIRFDWRPYG